MNKKTMKQKTYKKEEASCEWIEGIFVGLAIALALICIIFLLSQVSASSISSLNQTNVTPVNITSIMDINSTKPLADELNRTTKIEEASDESKRILTYVVLTILILIASIALYFILRRKNE
jgi:hypothetical protein